MHLFHGFGSNLGTWEYTQDALAQKCNSIVTSTDLCGFGLTQRSLRVKDYTTKVNGMLGRRVLQSELERAVSSSHADGQSVVLVGHSLGGLIAATETVRKPEGVSAVVLVSPALVGFTGESKQVSMVGWFTRLFTVLAYLWREYVARFFIQVTLWCLQPLTFLSLRFSFRPKSAWINGLKSAYSENFQVQDVVNRYR